jgi:mono/diheme cytochrome c family protein
MKNSGNAVTPWIAALALVFLGAAAHAQDAGDAARGRIYAQDTCATCHAVSGNGSSPNAAAPRFAEIAAVPGMTAIAVNASLQTSHRSMPNLIIPQGDRADVVAYILSLRPK